MKEMKIKACEVSFSTMIGISFRNITFHDFEAKIFTIGKERTKRQYRSTDEVTFIKGHLDTVSLNDKKYNRIDEATSQRMFPPSPEDLKRDLSIWEEIKGMDKLGGCCGIGIKLEEAIKKGERECK